MNPPTQSVSVYRELAEWYERHGQVPMRDRFLILAADAALAADQADEAERLRQRVLQGSRHHMLRPYASFVEAAQAADVQTYVRDLRVNYPPEVAANLLHTLRATEAEGAPGDVPSGAFVRPAPPEPANEIPPTAPLIDLHGPGRRPTDRAGRNEPAPRLDSRQSFPVPFDDEEAPPAKPPAPQQPRPATGGGTGPMSRPAPASALPVTRPIQQPLPRATAKPAPAAPPPAPRKPAEAPAPLPRPAAPAEPPTPQAGSWLSSALFGILLALALALAAFTLARPFLPPEWLP